MLFSPTLTLETGKIILTGFGIALVLQVVGFLWYGPLFGKLYLKLAHPNKVLTAPENTIYVKCLIVTLINVFVTRILIESLEDRTHTAILYFTGYIALIMLMFTVLHDMFDGKPFYLSLLHSAYNLLILLIAIHVWWLSGYISVQKDVC